MIRYTLRCECGHAFESWFQSSSAYDSQAKRKLVSCPACGSVKVDKAIMAPQIVGKKGRESAVPAPVEPAEVTPPPAPTQPSSTPFPSEARKMHYGDIEHRPIYGEASPDEARALIDEGVEVTPLPVLPDDRN
jgi:hypothetical protein